MLDETNMTAWASTVWARGIMNIDEIVGALPENLRDGAKSAISEAISSANPVAKIANKEEALDFMAKNPVFSSALDAARTKAIESHSEKFMKEKFPELVEAEIRKRDPNTDPVKAELAAMKAELAAERERAKKEKLLSDAIARAAKAGIPTDDIARFIEADEEGTAASVDGYAKRWKASVAQAVEAELKARLGNNGQPKGGSATPPADLKSQYEAAAKAGNGVEMLRLKSLLQAAAINQE